MKVNLKGIPLPEMETHFAKRGHAPYRARQLFLWMYQKKERQFGRMSDLSKKFREQLEAEYYIPSLAVKKKHPSSDGTFKYLVELKDGQRVESVYIPNEGRKTLCISTQVGCKMACTFCATGYQGFVRNLESWEIVEQLMCVPTPEPVSNIVLMGMGEPFDNYEAMKSAIEIFRHPSGFQIGKRHITVSTVGLTPEIQRFADDDLGKLAISLHGTTEAQRAEIMPINKKYPIQHLMQVCRDLKFKTRNRVTFEYLLIKGFNDTDQDANRLSKLVADIPCKINLLSYNPNTFVDFERPSEERVLAFQRILLNKNLTVTYRRSRGGDVAAACGQLRTGVKKAAKLSV